MIDTHLHLTDEKLINDLDYIIEKAFENNINYLINNTSNYIDTIKSLEISNKYKNIYTTIGIHPLDVEDDKTENILLLENYINNPKVVAIGEIGLDYHYSINTKELQKIFFNKQLELAQKYDLPVVIHGRDAVSDAIDIVKKYKVSGVFHCFNGNIDQLNTILNLGFYIGFDGPITFKKNEEFIQILNNTPIDKILCETDSPYLAPVPYRGKINQPAYVKFVYDKISEIKSISFIELKQIIHNNVFKLFNKMKE